MALSYKARKRWSLVILLIGLPVYILVAYTLPPMLFTDRPPILVELLIYIALGFAWILPFRKVFTGVGMADPDAEDGADNKKAE